MSRTDSDPPEFITAVGQRHWPIDEVRSPNGDLTFPHNDHDDPIINARNNLRYWMDRYPAGGPEVNNAAKHLVAVLDQNWRSR